jgi:hypothetical protein
MTPPALYPNGARGSAGCPSLRLLSGRFAGAKNWAEHPVENCVSGNRTKNYPRLGSLELGFDVLTMPDDSGHRILTYTAS